MTSSRWLRQARDQQACHCWCSDRLQDRSSWKRSLATVDLVKFGVVAGEAKVLQSKYFQVVRNVLGRAKLKFTKQRCCVTIIFLDLLRLITKIMEHGRSCGSWLITMKMAHYSIFSRCIPLTEELWYWWRSQSLPDWHTCTWISLELMSRTARRSVKSAKSARANPALHIAIWRARTFSLRPILVALSATWALPFATTPKLTQLIFRRRIVSARNVTWHQRWVVHFLHAHRAVF